MSIEFIPLTEPPVTELAAVAARPRALLVSSPGLPAGATLLLAEAAAPTFAGESIQPTELLAVGPRAEALLLSGAGTALLGQAERPVFFGSSAPPPTVDLTTLYAAAPAAVFEGSATIIRYAQMVAEAPAPECLMLSGVESAMLAVAQAPTFFGYSASPARAWATAFQPAGWAWSVGSEPLRITGLAEGIRLGDQLTPTGILRLLERIRLGPSLLTRLEQIEALREGMTLGDRVTGIVRVQLVEGIALGDTPAGMAIIARQLVDTIALTAGITATQEVIALVAVALALRDAGHPAESVLVTEAASLSASVLQQATDYMALIERIRLNDVPAGSALLSAIVSERFSLSASLTDTAELTKLLTEAIALRLEVADGDAPLVAWVLSPESRAAWTYADWPFNSYAEIAGRQYAMGPTGIVELGGDDDDGEAIAARLRTGLTNLGTGRGKRIEGAYLGYTSDGQLGLAVTVTSPDGTKTEHRYLMRPRTDGGAMHEGRIKVGRGMKSVFWQFEVHNVDGAAFELHDLQLLPMILDRRV